MIKSHAYAILGVIEKKTKKEKNFDWLRSEILGLKTLIMDKQMILTKNFGRLI